MNQELGSLLSRRWFLRDCGIGMAGLAVNSLLAKESGNALAPKRPHSNSKVKRVVYLFQAGAPSHLELFDHKPELTKRNGQLPPKELLKDYRSAFINPNSALLGPKWSFEKHGQCGMELSEVLPHTSAIADELCLIRTMNTEAVNHAPAQIYMNTGSQQFGRPSLGAWTLYGLGSQSSELPGYVVLTSAKGTSGGASNYGCGFLPTVYSSVPFRGKGDPILYLSNPDGFDDETQRASLDTLNRLNRMTLDEIADPETAARIQSYEQAYRLQSSAPELMDLSQEPQHVLDLYGIKDKSQSTFARNCLLARRLLERDVRFVQLFHEVWDQHGNLKNGVKKNAQDTDQPAAALIKDLKARGMLDDTLVIWAGEFGRTPMVQGGNDGRDHHNRSFSIWLAGGGVKKGHIYGETDDFGFNVARDPVHVHDLNATLLHLLGFDHERLTYRFQGRDFRLTDVHGHVVKGILA
ncbi:MAG: sulfatase [Verrucomicrobiales bacterium]|nr:sulfatase [Verrucomicrobiales bacterium]|tara:strand:+ start:4360 stop:5754 length:1395 start_codon:yes stop_codon:yes gene_type:complete